MKRLVLTLITGLGLLGALAPAPAMADPSAELAIEDNNVLFDPVARTITLPIWKALGVDVVRVSARWNRLAPDPRSPVKPAGFNSENPVDPRYNWAELDAGIAALLRNGLRPQVVIPNAGPLWASRQPFRGLPEYRPRVSEFAAFAGAVARRYRGAVSRFLVGNEPNQRFFLQPQLECKGRKCVSVAPHLYRQMLTAAIPRIRAASPGAQLLIGELAPIGSTVRNANSSHKPLAFLREMGCVDKAFKRIRTGLCAGFRAAPPADGFAFHPYQVKAKPDEVQKDPDLVKLGDLPKLFATLDKLTGARRLRATTGRFNVYLTEFGYETSPPDLANGVTAAQQAQYLQQAGYIAWATPRVKLISQYGWRDEPLKSEGPGRRAFGAFQSGLVFQNGAPKPALLVFANPFFINRKTNTLWGQVRPGGRHTVIIKKETAPGSGVFLPVATQRTDARGYFSRKIAPARGANYVFEYIGLLGRPARSAAARAR